MREPTSQTDPDATSPKTDLTQEEIATREYERFLRQGLGEHDALCDWEETERELRGRLKRSADTPEDISPENIPPKNRGSR